MVHSKRSKTGNDVSGFHRHVIASPVRVVVGEAASAIIEGNDLSRGRRVGRELFGKGVKIAGIACETRKADHRQAGIGFAIEAGMKPQPVLR